MTIRDPKAYMAGVWDWAILRGCFGPKMEPTDLDGTIERNGYILVIETKRPGAPVPTGQRITFQNMVKTGYVTVLVLWGNTDNPTGYELWTRQGVDRHNPATLDDVRQVCVNWYAWANARRARYFEMETYGGEQPTNDITETIPDFLVTGRHPTDGRGGQDGLVGNGYTAIT